MAELKERARVLIADDEKNFTRVLKTELGREGYQVEVAGDGKEAVSRIRSHEFDVLILDLRMPKLGGLEVLRELRGRDLAPEVIVLTGHASISTAITAMKLGAYDYLTKPCKTGELNLMIRKAFEKRQLVRENLHLRTRVAHNDQFPEIITQSRCMQAVLDMVARVAPTDSTVLLAGESGTGKELIARAIHQHSKRKDGPFLAINCGALQETILESELFGHERGAFTGAHSLKLGLFEVAHGGTLLLDEVGEIPPGMQVKLLRMIETGCFFRVGGTRERQANVRIIAATNRDLKADVRDGRFREDLYYRLVMIPITLPPLRERPDDVPLLTQHILRLYKGLGKKTVTPAALDLMRRYPWPGNIRELQHALRRALILAPKDRIEPADLPCDLQMRTDSFPGADTAGPRSRGPAAGTLCTLATLEREHIQRVLQQVGGHRGRAAEVLGIDPKTLYRKILTYKLESPESRRPKSRSR
ncbi:MAG: sigma-54-dependent transcriptional regulator [Candidatus Methylomirabilales bacterium]